MGSQLAAMWEKEPKVIFCMIVCSTSHLQTVWRQKMSSTTIAVQSSSLNWSGAHVHVCICQWLHLSLTSGDSCILQTLWLDNAFIDDRLGWLKELGVKGDRVRFVYARLPTVLTADKDHFQPQLDFLAGA